MSVTPEAIAAFVDDALDAAARARVAEAALRDPAVAAQIAAQRNLRDTLRAHFAGAADEPVPQDWITTIRAASATPGLTPRDWRLSQRRWTGAAIAASLVIGVVIGAVIGAATGAPWRTPPLLVAGQGGLLAAGDLAHALDTQLATAQAPAPIRILGTFRRPQGNLCRVFAGGVASGIACHGEAGWQMQQVMPGVATERGDYRQAGSAQGDVMAAAQAMAAGDPLTAEQESAARAHGWH